METEAAEVFSNSAYDSTPGVQLETRVDTGFQARNHLSIARISIMQYKSAMLAQMLVTKVHAIQTTTTHAVTVHSHNGVFGLKAACLLTNPKFV